MSTRDFEVHQEDDVVPSRRLVRISIASLVVALVGVFFAGLSLVLHDGALQPSFAGPGGPGAAPHEISHVEQTPIWDTRRGEDLEREQRRQLQSWGWVDRDAGLARIPIDRAMDLVVEESR